MKYRRALFPILVAAMFVLRAPTAFACSCLETTTTGDFRLASAVFTGTVTSVDAQSSETIVHVRVDKVFKGAVASEVKIRSSRASTCNTEFVTGSRYAIFADAEGTFFRTTICSGTTTDTGVLARAGFTQSRDPVALPSSVGVIPSAHDSARTGEIIAAVILMITAAVLIWRSRIARGTRRTGQNG